MVPNAAVVTSIAKMNRFDFKKSTPFNFITKEKFIRPEEAKVDTSNIFTGLRNTALSNFISKPPRQDTSSVKCKGTSIMWVFSPVISA